MSEPDGRAPLEVARVEAGYGVTPADSRAPDASRSEGQRR